MTTPYLIFVEEVRSDVDVLEENNTSVVDEQAPPSVITDIPTSGSLAGPAAQGPPGPPGAGANVTVASVAPTSQDPGSEGDLWAVI